MWNCLLASCSFESCIWVGMWFLFYRIVQKLFLAPEGIATVQVNCCWMALYFCGWSQVHFELCASRRFPCAGCNYSHHQSSQWQYVLGPWLLPCELIFSTEAHRILFQHFCSRISETFTSPVGTQLHLDRREAEREVKWQAVLPAVNPTPGVNSCFLWALLVGWCISTGVRGLHHYNSKYSQQRSVCALKNIWGVSGGASSLCGTYREYNIKRLEPDTAMLPPPLSASILLSENVQTHLPTVLRINTVKSVGYLQKPHNY